eukprot:s221_g14.t1
MRVPIASGTFNPFDSVPGSPLESGCAISMFIHSLITSAWGAAGSFEIKDVFCQSLAGYYLLLLASRQAVKKYDDKWNRHFLPATTFRNLCFVAAHAAIACIHWPEDLHWRPGSSCAQSFFGVLDGPKFFMADPSPDGDTVAGLPSAAPEELEFEDWGVGAEEDDMDISEIDALVTVADDGPVVLSDLEKLQVLEDRSKIQSEMEVLQKDLKDIADGSAPGPENLGENPAAAEEQKIAVEDDFPMLTFRDFIDALKDKPAFDKSRKESLGAIGCLDRIRAMTPYMKVFCSFICIEDGLISKSAVKGKCHRENEWNLMMHELHKAKQYARYRAGRSSRMSTWMSVQEELSHAAFPDEEDPEARPIVAVTACRPISSPEVQVVIFKSKASLISYDVGLILSTYRGSINKAKATSRRMCMSKPLATSAPPQVVSKVKLLLMEKLDDKSFVTHSLSTAMKALQSLNAGELMFGKKDDAKAKKLKKIEQADGEELFFKKLPDAFEKQDKVTILNGAGEVKVNGKMHKWSTIVKRAPMWFSIILDGKPVKEYSASVYWKLRDLQPREGYKNAEKHLHHSLKQLDSVAPAVTGVASVPPPPTAPSNTSQALDEQANQRLGRLESALLALKPQIEAMVAIQSKQLTSASSNNLAAPRGVSQPLALA